MFKLKDFDKIFYKWEKVRIEVLNFLNPNEVNMVRCHRRGRDESDNFPTVIMVVDTKLNKSWKVTRELIIAVLDSCRLPMVGVEIMKGSGEKAPKSPVGLRRSHIRGPAHFGVSLGLEGLIDEFTTEHSIVRNGGKEFSTPGDSGSLVWNDENAMVGILFAGCPETRTSYFTHKTDLFADILSMTGANCYQTQARNQSTWSEWWHWPNLPHGCFL